MNNNISIKANEGAVLGIIYELGVLLPIPIEDATVKLFSTTGLPLYHTGTDAQGVYLIENVPPGSYNITVAKEGYLTTVGRSIIVPSNNVTIQNIAMTVDTDASLNTIYGKISVEGELTRPIDQARVEILKVESGTNTLIATTFTNADGQYLLPYLTAGQYIVKVVKQNYDSGETTVTISSSSTSQKIPLNLSLKPQGLSNYGTVSGVITDESTKAPIPYAIVGLYKVDTDGSETLIQLIKANANGRYLFGNVTEGTVLVKAFSKIDETP